MNNKKVQDVDLRPYRIFGLPLLILLGLIGLAGILLTIVTNLIF